MSLQRRHFKSTRWAGLFFAPLFFFVPNSVAQKVGIGTTDPRQALHIRSLDSNLLLLHNNNELLANVPSSMYFRTGTWYTGGIKTIGQSSNTARLSFYTFAAQDSLGLLERLSILDNGRTGIGTAQPRASLEVAGNTPSQLTLTQPLGLQNARTTSLFFRTGGAYTGAIKTIGNSGSSARLSFFTFVSPDSLDQQERMTIANDGNIGIGNATPQFRLDVVGQSNFTHNQVGVAALQASNNGSNYASPAIKANGNLVALAAQATNNLGIGVLGYVTGDASMPPFIGGAGVEGFSNSGHGVAGVTADASKAGVLGLANANGATGGRFDNGSLSGFTNTLALKTIGGVQLTNIGEGAGKVLTSDANGNATWQTPTITAAKGFKAYLTSDQVLVTGNPVTLGNMTEIFDVGNLFTTNSNSFTAPETGLYQVTLQLIIDLNSTSVVSRFYTTLRVNGAANVASRVDGLIPATGASTWVASHNHTQLVRLNAGDVVTFEMTGNFSGTAFEVRGGGFVNTSSLSIHKVN